MQYKKRYKTYYTHNKAYSNKGYQIKEFTVATNTTLNANSTKTYYITTDFPNGILGLQKVIRETVSDGSRADITFSSSHVCGLSDINGNTAKAVVSRTASTNSTTKSNIIFCIIGY